MPANETIRWASLVLAAFFAGSIPFSLLVGLARGVDIRKVGSGNVGATNLGRALGRPFFFLGFALDMLKGLVPTLAAGWLTGSLGRLDLPPSAAWPWLLVMLACVLGHVFSPWLGFRGGKGVATSCGALLGVYPALTLPAILALGIYLLCLATSRYVSLSSMVSAGTIPPLVWAQFRFAKPLGLAPASPTLSHALPFLLVSGALAGLVIWTHRANLHRLRAGTEPKIGQRVSQAPPPPSA